MVKKIFILSIFLSISQISLAKCFLYIEKTGNLNPTIISTLAISLISQYIERLEDTPLSGLTETDCMYKIGLTESQSGVFVTISGRNLSAYGDSSKSGVDGLQIALLRAIYRAKLEIKDSICKAYGTILLEDCNGKIQTASGNTSNQKLTSQFPPVEQDGFLFQINSCERSSSGVTCNLTITSQGQDRDFGFAGSYSSSKLYDEFGNVYYGTSYSIANLSDKSYIYHFMIADLPIRASVSFKEVPKDSKMVTFLSLSTKTKDYKNLNFRNIPISE
ncbi:hypothetical protein KKA14_12445 [bacterium]|nr:hypothetical protein [bacterium]